ncbi:MAG: hypothetical protein ACRCWF_11020 [Beijerinckiaceae bacterium]
MTNPNDRTSEEARRDLARLAREGESLGGTAMDNASRDLARGDDEDHIDRLGKKIGRGIAFAILPFLVWYFGSTAGWW